MVEYVQGYDPPLHNLTPPMMALVKACEEMGGSGQEQAIQKLAVKHEAAIERERGNDSFQLILDPERPERSLHNHYSGAADGLAGRNLFEPYRVGKGRYWRLSENAWLALGHPGRPYSEPTLFG